MLAVLVAAVVTLAALVVAISVAALVVANLPGVLTFRDMSDVASMSRAAECDSACDRISPRRRSSWGRCCFVSRAILQQADAGRALRSLLGDRGIDRTANHSL
jgi:hypothetical protein